MQKEPEDFLSYQRDNRMSYWEDKIAFGETFFNFICNYSGDWNDIKKSLENWLVYFKRKPEWKKKQEQCQHALKLVICGSKVFQKKSNFIEKDPRSQKKFAESLRKEVEDLLRSHRLDYKVEIDELLMLCFLFANEQSDRIAKIHFATNNGQIHQLEIQIVYGYGNVTRNPKILPKEKDYPQIEDSFSSSIKTAFKFNRKFWKDFANEEQRLLWQKANKDFEFDKFGVIWDATLFEEDKKFANLSGSSAGLAASVGIYHALLNQVPDDRIVFSVEIEDGATLKLKAVDEKGLPNKINAALGTNYIDTFVIHPKNYDSLNELNRNNFQIKSIGSENDFPNLAEIANIKSKLIREMEKCLGETREKLNKLDWFVDNQHLRIDSLHIDQNVLKLISCPISAINQNNTSSNNLEELETHKFLEMKNSNKWREVISEKSSRVIVLGSPGSGKSFSTKFTVIQEIDKALNKLKYNSCKIEEIEIPIWTTASELVEQYRQNQKYLFENILKNLMSKHGLSKNFYTFVRNKETEASSDLRHNSSFLLVIDSLDELKKEDLPTFKKITSKLNNYSIRIVITCRKLQWESRSNSLDLSNFDIIEILPFNFPQQMVFIKKFFSTNEEAQNEITQLLDTNESLIYAFTTPLLLTLGCFLHNYSDLRSTNLINLYDRVIDKIFTGIWRESKPYWNIDKASTFRHQNLLNKICWHLFENSPESNLFNLDQWTDACYKNKSILPEKDIDCDRFLKALLDLGLIIEAGVVNVSVPQYSFAHKTFFEYLAAKAIKKDENCLKIMDKNLTNPKWVEVITFVGGLLDEITFRKLLRILQDKKDDVFGSLILLEAKLIGVSVLESGTEIDNIVRLVSFGLSEIWENNSVRNNRGSSRKRVSFNNLKQTYKFLNINNSIKNKISEDVDKILENVLIKDNGRSEEIIRKIQILEKMNLYNKRSIEFLLAIIKDDDQPSNLRISSLHVLSSLGRGRIEILEELVEIVENESIFLDIRAEACTSLSKLEITDEKTFTKLKAILLSDNINPLLKIASAKAISKLERSDSECNQVLSNIVKNERISLELRSEVCNILLNLGENSEKKLALLKEFVSSVTNPEVLNLESLKTLLKVGYATKENQEWFKEIIENSKTSDEFHFQILLFLGELGKSNENISTLLKTIVNDVNQETEFLQIAAQVSLLRLGNEISSEEFIRLLDKVLTFQDKENLKHILPLAEELILLSCNKYQLFSPTQIDRILEAFRGLIEPFIKKDKFVIDLVIIQAIDKFCQNTGTKFV